MKPMPQSGVRQPPGSEHMRQDATHDLRHAGFVGVHAVRLVQFRIGSDAFEKKG